MRSLAVRVCFALLSLALLMISAAPSTADSDVSAVLQSRDARVREVLARPTISRISELPRLPVSLKKYEFLLDHPRLAMILAHSCDPSLDLYKVDVGRDGVIHVVDPAGLAGDMELVSAARGKRVYFVSGHFDILKMRFYSQMVFSISYAEGPKGAAPSVDSATASYIKISSTFAGLVAKMAAFLFPKKVDGRIGRFTNAIRKVAVAVQDNPPATYRMLAASGQVDARELKEFAELFLPGK